MGAQDATQEEVNSALGATQEGAQDATQERTKGETAAAQEVTTQHRFGASGELVGTGVTNKHRGSLLQRRKQRDADTEKTERDKGKEDVTQDVTQRKEETQDATQENTAGDATQEGAQDATQQNSALDATQEGAAAAQEVITDVTQEQAQGSAGAQARAGATGTGECSGDCDKEKQQGQSLLQRRKHRDAESKRDADTEKKRGSIRAHMEKEETQDATQFHTGKEETQDATQQKFNAQEATQAEVNAQDATQEGTAAAQEVLTDATQEGAQGTSQEAGVSAETQAGDRTSLEQKQSLDGQTTHWSQQKAWKGRAPKGPKIPPQDVCDKKCVGVLVVLSRRSTTFCSTTAKTSSSTLKHNFYYR